MNRLLSAAGLRAAVRICPTLLLLSIGTASAFVHPGLTNNKVELDYIKQQIKTGAQPWKNAYDMLASSSQASLSYKASPKTSVECGRYTNPNRGCTEERNDAAAAYAHALMWVLGGDVAHAKKSIEIMNAWSGTLKSHSLANATLQAGWSACNWMRAAEIIRYTGGGWAEADMARFSGMLRDVYVRDLSQKQPGVDGLISIFGNWDLTIIAALAGIAVYLDDEALFRQALDKYRKRMASYIYVAADGPQPVAPPDAPNASLGQIVEYWFGQDVFKDGVSAETCRDMGHFQYGLSAMMITAEIALKQGVDVYAELKQRMVAAMELHAPIVLGGAAPGWMCQGKVDRSVGPSWEMGYNHFHNRLGMDMPNSKKVIDKIRPTGQSYHMAWESLTHAELGSHGLPASVRGSVTMSGSAREGARLTLLFDRGGVMPVIAKTAADGSRRYWNLDGSLR